MNALVVFHSRHGATEEAAHAVGRGLAAAGHKAEVLPLASAPASLASYNLVVLGGPIYMGSWPKELLAWMACRKAELDLARLALFILGSLPEDHAAKLRSALGASEAESLLPRIEAVARFGGRLPTHGASLGERLIMRLVGSMSAREGIRPVQLDLAEAEAFGSSLGSSQGACPHTKIHA